jgi:flagellar basal body-associated protein FliL
MESHFLEANNMAQPQEPGQKKDLFWVYIGLLIVAVIVGVFLLKSREMQSVPYSAYEETKKEVEQQLKEAK